MKLWLIIGLVLIILGILLLNIGTSAAFGKITLRTAAYETNSYEIAESYHDMAIQTNTANLRLLPAPDGKTRVECYEETNAKHLVSAEDGTLCIRVIHEKKWYERIGINLETPTITIYLPEGEYGRFSFCGSTGDVALPENFLFESIDVDLSTGDATCLASAKKTIHIETSTGNIHAKNLHARALDLAVTTGQISLNSVSCDEEIHVDVSTGKSFFEYVTCQSLDYDGSTGTITLKNVMASKTIEIEQTTGDVIFDACDAAELDIETTTGDVTGTLLSDKIFLAKTTTGRVNLPKTVSGGHCEIETTTGNIKLEILE